MWWYADLPAAFDGAGAPETPSEFAQGEFLLEWILPSLADDQDNAGDPPALADAERRALRRELRDAD